VAVAYADGDSDSEWSSDSAFVVACPALKVSGRKGHSRNIWIADSGATSHMTGDESGLVDWEETNDSVIVGNGESLKITKVGTWKGRVEQKDGSTAEIRLANVKVVPGLVTNLFAINSSIEKGWEVSYKGKEMTLKKRKKRITFDKILQYDDGFLGGVKIIPLGSEKKDKANVSKEKKEKELKSANDDEKTSKNDKSGKNEESESKNEDRETNTRESKKENEEKLKKEVENSKQLKNEENAEKKKRKEKKRRMSVAAMHQLLGHPSEKFVKGSKNFLNCELKNDDENVATCEACAMSKARRKGVSKEKKEKSEIPGERIFIDIASVKATSIGGSKFWLLATDDATGMSWSYFLKEKSETTEKVYELIRDLMAKHDRKVRFIRCDNAGENVSLEKKLKREGMGIQMEYTARKTPEQNGRVERLFQTLFGRIRSCFNGARMTKKMKLKLWAECASYVTDCHNIITSDGNCEPPHLAFYGEMPRYSKHLRRFGEVAVVTKFGSNEIKGKLADRGFKCLFMGYAKNHAGDVYRMLDPLTKRIKTSRDTKWLKTFDWRSEAKELTDEDKEDPNIFVLEQSDESEDEDLPPPFDREEENEEEEDTAPDVTEEPLPDPLEAARETETTVSRAVQQLETSFNPVLNEGGDDRMTLRSGKVLANVALNTLTVKTVEREKQNEEEDEDKNEKEEQDKRKREDNEERKRKGWCLG